MKRSTSWARHQGISSTWSFFTETNTFHTLKISQDCKFVGPDQTFSVPILAHLGTSPLRNAWDSVNFPSKSTNLEPSHRPRGPCPSSQGGELCCKHWLAVQIARFECSGARLITGLIYVDFTGWIEEGSIIITIQLPTSSFAIQIYANDCKCSF